MPTFYKHLTLALFFMGNLFSFISAHALEPTTSKGAPTVKIEELKEGTGEVAKKGQTLSMHYEGKLTSGLMFDSSRKRNQPFQFTVGTGSVIKGWDEGIPGMKVGGKRRLTIPPEMGYGARGAGKDIPPHATLIFEVELLEIKK